MGFLADLTFVGYYANPRVGTALYNLVHTTFFPLNLAFLGFAAGHSFALFVGLVMLAYIGFDRAAGYGLKYPDGFGHTHFGG